jgi:predicted CoA-binding protein
MAKVPGDVSAFLQGKRFAVAGVSRDHTQPANAIFRKLRSAGYDVVAVNPSATQVEGVTSYADLLAVPGPIDGAIVATPPAAALDLVRQCASRGVRRVWFHRSFGDGSVSDAAVSECAAHGIACIVGGCPMMYCPPVDIAHRCMRWLLGWQGKVPR